MSQNGGNAWDVPYSHITWFQRLLKTHDNVIAVDRHHDIVFEIDRAKPGDHLTVLCLREYAFGLTLVHRAVAEFGKFNLIYIGGGWNRYTQEAKEYCLNAQIGLYVTEDMAGALWRPDFWSYHRKDKDGDPLYNYRSA